MKDLLQGNIRFVVPRFQRRYAWTKEQWEPLWDDIVSVVGACGDISDVPRHFLGAIVVRDVPGWAPGLYEVVDGQQRLTTLQLLFGAVLAVARASKPEDRRDARISDRQVTLLQRLTVNDGPAIPAYPPGSADGQLKVWPSRNDQAAFRRAMMVGGPGRTTLRDDPLPLQAYDFFVRSAQAWFNRHRRDPMAFAKLVAVLREGLYAVVIRLEPADDPQVVFERLNARRMPLQASDFVRNHLFALAVGRNLSADWLYDQHWARFDEPYWESQVRGRPRIDQFLSDFLVMETGRQVPSGQLFAQFAKYIATTRAPLETVMAGIAEYGDVFRRLDTLTGLDPVEHEFLDHLRIMDLSTMTPVLLRLMHDFKPDERHLALRKLDGYLVRRMIVDAPTNDYGAVAARVAHELNGARRPAERIATFLTNLTAKGNIWPDDREVTRVVTDTRIATTLPAFRLRMVLKIVEVGLRDPLTEPVDFDEGKLTIEHLMPITWAQHWPRSGEDPAARDHNVHTLGNLTLVTEDLNELLGNTAWSTKLPLIREHSGLRLNQHFPEEWTVRALRERGRRLALALCSALPGPTPALVPASASTAAAPASAAPASATLSAPASPADSESDRIAPTPPASPPDGPSDSLGGSPPQGAPERGLSTSDGGGHHAAPAGGPAPVSPLEHHFALQMRRLYQELQQQLNTRTNGLRELVNRRGGLGAAQQLLSESEPSDTTRLAFGRGRPDLSVEALVLRPEFAPLFTGKELEVARERLDGAGARTEPPAGTS